MGITSVPKALKNVCMEGVQIRNDSGTDYIQISEQGILLKSKNIRIEGTTDILGVTTINGSRIGTDGTSTIKGNVNITGDAVIGGISFAGHTHSGVETGGGSTQTPK